VFILFLNPPPPPPPPPPSPPPPPPPPRPFLRMVFPLTLYLTYKCTYTAQFDCLSTVNLLYAMPSFIHSHNSNVLKYVFSFSCISGVYEYYSLPCGLRDQLDVTSYYIYFSFIGCSTCFGPPCAHLQELTT